MPYTPTELTRLIGYTLAAIAGLVLVIVGAIRGDGALIGTGLALLGYAVPAAKVNRTADPEPVTIEPLDVAEDPELQELDQAAEPKRLAVGFNRRT